MNEFITAVQSATVADYVFWGLIGLGFLATLYDIMWGEK